MDILSSLLASGAYDDEGLPLDQASFRDSVVKLLDLSDGDLESIATAAKDLLGKRKGARKKVAEVARELSVDDEDFEELLSVALVLQSWAVYSEISATELVERIASLAGSETDLSKRSSALQRAFLISQADTDEMLTRQAFSVGARLERLAFQTCLKGTRLASGEAKLFPGAEWTIHYRDSHNRRRSIVLGMTARELQDLQTEIGAYLARLKTLKPQTLERAASAKRR